MRSALSGLETEEVRARVTEPSSVCAAVFNYPSHTHCREQMRSCTRTERRQFRTCSNAYALYLQSNPVETGPYD